MMQCKDISDFGVLRWLAGRQGKWCNWYADNPDSVREAMPAGIHDHLVLAKMKSLVRRGLVGGCACGCRGDFHISKKGLEFVQMRMTADFLGYPKDYK